MSTIFIFALIFVAMYFFMIRPQQRKARQHRDLLSALEVGDEVITTSGLYGMISAFDGGTVFIEVSPGVEMKISRDAIANIVTYPDDVDEVTDGDGSDEVSDDR